MDNKQELAPAITVRANGVIHIYRRDGDSDRYVGAAICGDEESAKWIMDAVAAQEVLRSILATDRLGPLRRFLDPLVDKITVG